MMEFSQRHALAGLMAMAVLTTAGCSEKGDSPSEAQQDMQFDGAIEKTVIGEVNAMIDGESYRGATLDVPSEGTSTAEFQKFGPLTRISLQAHDAKAESIMRNVFNIEFALNGTGESAAATDASILYHPEGMDKPFYTSESNAQAAQVSLDAVTLSDGRASISGRFSASLCRKTSYFSEADTGDCIPVEGMFDTALRDGTPSGS